jgi:hypothetical protein
MGSFFFILLDANELMVDKQKDRNIHFCKFWIIVVVGCAAMTSTIVPFEHSISCFRIS